MKQNKALTFFIIIVLLTSCFIGLIKFANAQNFSFRINKYGALFSMPTQGEITFSRGTITTKTLQPGTLMEEGGQQWAVTFSRRPPTNSITIPISKLDLHLFYQPPLTEEFNQSDCEIWTPTHIKLLNGREFFRPIDMVGGYVAYHASKWDNDFKTGKLFNLLVPRITDANNVTVYGSYNRDAETTNQLTISAPQTFLDTATYPIVVDPDFGYTTGGASSDNGGDANIKWGCQYAPVTAGVLANISAYFYTDFTGSFTTAIYSDSSNTPNALLESKTLSATAETTQFNPATGYSISLSATNYWLTFSRSAHYAEFHYDTASTYRARSASDALPLSDPFGAGTDTTDRHYSIYGTYVLNFYPYVQQISNIDSVADVGTHSNFTAQQYGPDGINDTLTEANVNAVSNSFGNPATTGTTYSSVALDALNGGLWASGSSATSVYNVTFFGSETGSGTRSVKAVICNSTGHILTNGVGGAVTVSGTTLAWYTSTFATPPTISGSTNYALMLVSDSAGFRMAYSSTSGGTEYTDASNSYTTPTNPTDWSQVNATNYRIYANTSYTVDYRLALEEQFTSIPTGYTYRNISIFMGPQSGSEAVNVEGWNAGNSTWTTIKGSCVQNSWNNVSITPWITSSNTTFYIRFTDVVPGDAAPGDTWQIDACLLDFYNASNPNYPVALSYSQSYSWGNGIKWGSIEGMSRTITASWSQLPKWSSIVLASQAIGAAFNAVIVHGSKTGLTGSLATTWNVLSGWSSKIGITQSIGTSWNILSKWSSNIKIDQSISGSFSSLTKWTSNVILTQSISFLYSVTIAVTAVNSYIIALSTSFSTSWNVLTKWSSNINMAQSISSSWNSLTRWTANINLSQSIGSSWNNLIKWASNIGIVQSISSSWNIFTRWSSNVVLTQSISATLNVSIILTSANNYLIALSTSITTSWNTLIQWTSNINLSGTLTDAWNALDKIGTKINLSSSLTSTWNAITSWGSRINLTQPFSTSWNVLSKWGANVSHSLTTNFSWNVNLATTIHDFFSNLSVSINLSWNVIVDHFGFIDEVGNMNNMVATGIIGSTFTGAVIFSLFYMRRRKNNYEEETNLT